MTVELNISVYIAAPSELVDMARRVADQFRRAGIEVTSRWLDQKSLKQTDFTDRENEGHALNDLRDIERAKVFVAINPEEWARQGTGGRHFEMGYASKCGKPIVLYGDRTNVFHFLPEVKHIEDPGDLVKGTIKHFKSIQP